MDYFYLTYSHHKYNINYFLPYNVLYYKVIFCTKHTSFKVSYYALDVSAWHHPQNGFDDALVVCFLAT